MSIETKSLTRFSEIKVGEVFQFDGQLFLKIHETQRHNTVSLSNNFSYMIECTAVVEPKKVRLVVE